MIIKRPEQYHGNSKKRPFFEGWYHKMSTEDGESIVLIPGIYRSGIENSKTAFLMIYQSINKQVDYLPYPTEAFKCEKDKYALKLGDSYFSLDHIKLNINNDKINIKGEIFSKGLNPWPVTILEPGCMGWYAYVPTMECFHGILSMKHSLSGEIKLNNRQVNFSNGKGYLEKDWGKNFPKNWIWGQSNHFLEPDLSVSASLATIPWRKNEFSGFIVGILHRDKFYRFTTYLNSKITHISFDGNTIEWCLRSRDIEVCLRISRGQKSGLLFAPDKKDMVPKVSEYLDGTMSIKLTKKGNTVLESYSKNAAVEIVGNTDKLILKAK